MDNRNDLHLLPIRMKTALIPYNLFLNLYSFGIRLIAPWNKKARLWLDGRKIQGKIKPIQGKDLVWMHCASLGEFEQGRPVLESLRKEQPGRTYVVSFFSPSGYEVRKDYKGADHIFYLPMGTRAEAKKFIAALSPSLVIWVKYEYWYHYLNELYQRKVPILLISALFRKDQPFFQWYGSLHREMLTYFKKIFVQDQGSKDLLHSIGIKKDVFVCGDTRFDRVLEIAEKATIIPLVEAFVRSNPVIVAGSTWQDDEEELVHLAKVNPDIKFILAPHQVEEHRLQEIEKLFPSTIRFSVFAKDPSIKSQVLLVDNIGMLSSLYRYATICYVGGAFGHDGVHNVLEAAVYGKPVVFGPVYDKYLEAVQLIESGAAFTVGSGIELETICTKLLEDDQLYAVTAEQSRNYVEENAGATPMIIECIRKENF